MRTEPHRSITKARVDYRFGDADARTKLIQANTEINLQVHVITLPEMLKQTTPRVDLVDSAYYHHNLQAVSAGTEAWAVTWVEGDTPRVETHIAIAPADDQLMRDNTRFQCAHELLETFRALMERALAIKAAQPVEADFVEVQR